MKIGQPVNFRDPDCTVTYQADDGMYRRNSLRTLKARRTSIQKTIAWLSEGICGPIQRYDEIFCVSRIAQSTRPPAPWNSAEEGQNWSARAPRQSLIGRNEMQQTLSKDREIEAGIECDYDEERNLPK